MRSRRYAIIEAPSVQARVAHRLETPPYGPERDPETLTLNAAAIAEWSPRLADAVEDVLDMDEFPFILGGDCSIVLGPMLALKRRGRYGLLFIDGHADFYQPEANPNGEAASMDLAFATGHGPDLLANIEGRGPLVREEDTVAFGFRDEDEQADYGSQPLPDALRAFDLATVRALGVEAAAREAVAHLTRSGLEGFFIHVDADVLNDDIMPAVDYRHRGGLTFAELAAVLHSALESGEAVGAEIAIYNPKLDRDGAAGRGLVETLAAALGESAPVRD